MSRTFLEQAMTRLAHEGPELKPGHVWLVGAGPGDPGLLTLRAPFLVVVVAAAVVAAALRALGWAT